MSSAESKSANWLFTAPVRYRGNHDGAVIGIEPGRRIELRESASSSDPGIYVDSTVYYADQGYKDRLKYRQVDTWKTGKLLQIAYSTETGAVLLDPVTRKHIEITGGLAKHPIDLLFEEGMDGSTAEIVSTANEAVKIWQEEIDRIYTRLSEESTTGKPGIFENARRAWHANYRAQLKAMREAYDREGTIYSISFALARLETVRNHALNIAGWGRY